MIPEFPKASRLPAPVRITEQVWPEGTVPVVSVRCITYNHVNFIRDAIEGFLMQETTFPIEILIHDDASTDGTADIVREYQTKYPQLIRAILQTENQYSKAIKPGGILDSQQRGEFIALCEGDDYWTSPLKLQKQVKVLEADLSVIGAFHAVKVTDEDGVFLKRLPSSNYGETLAFEDIVAENERATCSIIFRHQSPGPDLGWARDLPMGDWPLQASLALHGKWVMLPAVMGVYRKHKCGVWSGAGDERVMLGVLSFYDAVTKKFGLRALKVVCERRKNLLAALLYGAVRRGDWSTARNLLDKISKRDLPTIIVYSAMYVVVKWFKLCSSKVRVVFTTRFKIC
jgi:glycosyltransferase involved in cell wall biosynthesis